MKINPNLGLALIIVTVALCWAAIWDVNTKADQPFTNCSQVEAAGLHGLSKKDPLAVNLDDNDGDGKVCE